MSIYSSFSLSLSSWLSSNYLPKITTLTDNNEERRTDLTHPNHPLSSLVLDRCARERLGWDKVLLERGGRRWKVVSA